MQPLNTALINYFMAGVLGFPLILNLAYKKMVRNYHQVNFTRWSNLAESSSMPIGEQNSWLQNNRKGIGDCMNRDAEELSIR